MNFILQKLHEHEINDTDIFQFFIDALIIFGMVYIAVFQLMRCLTVFGFQ